MANTENLTIRTTLVALVCVCVCVREREREREKEKPPWVIEATVKPQEVDED